MNTLKEKIAGCGRWCARYKFRVFILLATFLLALPRPLRSQLVDPCCAIITAGLTSINSTITSIVGGGLNSISSIDKNIQNFEQTTVWPQQQISQALAAAGNVRGIYTQMQSLSNITINSATLAGPQQLEQTLLSRDPAKIAQANAQYQAVYGGIPTPTDAPPAVRDLIDSTEATAKALMKRAIQIDALADMQIKVAGQLMDSIQNAAPGSAPILEAEAQAWSIRAHANTQTAIADLLRAMAAEVANSAADTKLSAAEAASLDQQLQNLLKRP